MSQFLHAQNETASFACAQAADTSRLARAPGDEDSSNRVGDLLGDLLRTQNLGRPGTALRLTIGVDPGMLGALVVLADGIPDQFIDMPTVPHPKKGNNIDAFRLAALLRGVLQRHPVAHAFAALEGVSMRPENSRGSDQKTGEGLGILKGVLAALGVRWVVVQPQTWKRHFRLLKTEKDIARQFAMQRFPSHAIHLTRKKDNGRGDAALIALWAFETEQHV